jgi:hypothetical protein
MEEVWTKAFSVNGRDFEATFVRRPFREGLEVHCTVNGEIVRVAEFGFGEMALLEKLQVRVSELLGCVRS